MDTLQQLLSEAEEYQQYTNQKFSSDNPAAIKERMNTLDAYISRTGQMLAEAKLILNRKKSLQIAEVVTKIAKEGHLSAKAQNVIVDSIAEDEKYLVDLLDRLNATCTHQANHIQSQLSYEREHLRLTKTGY